MKQLILAFSIFISFGSNAQLNIDSLGWINYQSLHGTFLNDVWGYVDEFGNEYGLVGCEEGTSIVDVTDPANPFEVFWEPGTHSTWRDLKTWGDYAYVTTEATSGLLIIDMSPLPASTSLPVTFYNGPVGNPWASAHNLYIDSSGYAYIFGANRGNGGVIILDVATDPMNPIEVGTFDNWYVHDGYVLRDTMFLGHIYEGTMSMVDVTDKANPILLGTQFTPSTFSHNAWASPDGNYAFTTDEVTQGYIGAFDVSDPTNIFEVDRIQSSPGAGVIPHNTHVLNNFLITSYYSDGVVVHDVTYPYNMIEVGNYDTYFDQTTSYDGCWGAFPFLPSGLILATDRSEGFYILGPTYVQAAYLEGIVTDAITLLPIDQSEIVITGSNQNENSNSTGFYATGMANGGTYDVTYSKVGYFPQTISTNITNGIITTQDVQLTPLPPYSLIVNVLEQGTSTPINGADILLEGSLITHTGVTNGLGQENLTLYYEEIYNVIVGKWGYITECANIDIDNTTGAITVFLKPGIYDDFTFDFGWSSLGTASSGLWERGNPIGSNSGSAPEDDVNFDCGLNAYVTGNANTSDPDADDVDDGNAVLISPVMDLTIYPDPYVNYSRWFYNNFGPNPPEDDSLEVTVSNGSVNVRIDIVGKDPGTFFQWVNKSIRIADYLTVTNTMQFLFTTSDNNPNVNITEAGIDKFYIVDESELDLNELSHFSSVYPNPVQNTLNITGIEIETSYKIIGTDGTLVKEGKLEVGKNTLNIEQLKNGMYFLLFDDEVHKVLKSN